MENVKLGGGVEMPDGATQSTPPGLHRGAVVGDGDKFYVEQSRSDTPNSNRRTPVMSHTAYIDHTVTEVFLLTALHLIIFILFINICLETGTFVKIFNEVQFF